MDRLRCEAYGSLRRESSTNGYAHVLAPVIRQQIRDTCPPAECDRLVRHLVILPALSLAEAMFLMALPGS